MQEKNTFLGSGTRRAEMRIEILNQVVKENPIKATAEQRLPYGEGRSLWELPPSHPPTTVPFLWVLSPCLKTTTTTKKKTAKLCGFLELPSTSSITVFMNE